MGIFDSKLGKFTVLRDVIVNCIRKIHVKLFGLKCEFRQKPHKNYKLQTNAVRDT